MSITKKLIGNKRKLFERSEVCPISASINMKGADLEAANSRAFADFENLEDCA